jgi:hypothetical protein
MRVLCNYLKDLSLIALALILLGRYFTIALQNLDGGGFSFAIANSWDSIFPLRCVSHAFCLLKSSLRRDDNYSLCCLGELTAWHFADLDFHSPFSSSKLFPLVCSFLWENDSFLSRAFFSSNNSL